MPRIVAAAIQFYPEDSEYPQIVCGKRHCDCYEWMFKHRVVYDRSNYTEGFLTQENQFVDRYEAMHMALECGQIAPEDVENVNSPLYSEDLW